MQLNNDIEGLNLLRNTILEFFEREGSVIFCFFETKDDEWDYQYFLLNRKHVFRYGIGMDRDILIGGLELGIGPHYFGPAYFWNYQNSERFKMACNTDAVKHNLQLLKEFLSLKESS